MTKKLPITRFSRSKKIVSVATRFAVGELSRRLKKSELAERALLSQIEKIVDSLDQLKGFPMKLGQLISLDTTGLIPDQVRSLFDKLQMQATPIDHELMKQRFESECEKSDELKVDWKPIASASIGQVYLGSRLSGQPIVIKVQYPNIEHSLEGDLYLVQKLIPILNRLTGKDVEWDSVFEELQQMFQYEIDYVREAMMQERYGSHCEGEADFVVPKVYKEYSSRGVIVSDYLAGIDLNHWIKQNPSMERRLALAQRCLTLFCKEFFEWGLVQTDPNFANFLILEGDRLGLIDFGATLEYKEDFRSQYKALIKAMMAQDQDLVLKRAMEFQILDPRESFETQQAFLEMIQVSIEPFLKSGRFQFENSDYIERAKQTSLKFMKLAQFTAPPHHLLFLHRKLGGLYSLMQRLTVEMDLTSLLKSYIA